ncbi:DUF6130 family protein [Bradyrhizobium sp. dw_78]|uniref:DUF6130 family protein n=1 Tax=Bradyrhizobium sp. dw_78 TaxID=2719793 RepID=UPI001BD5225E|nr:DUF6130 family protein [Bradyrhizobium sp. dw_78]
MIHRSILAAATLSLLAMAAPIASRADGAEHAMHEPSTAAQPSASLAVMEALAGPLSRGVTVIPFRTENLKIVPVYGEAALSVTPRIGHLHITVDDASWHWLHATEEPIVIQGLPPGAHHVLLELADANHHVLDSRTIRFDIPRP